MRASVYAGAAALATLAVVSPALSGCASPGVPQAHVFVTRDQRIVVHAPSLRAGETILHVENDDGRSHVVVLARLGAGVQTLPLSGDAVAVGHPSEQSYDGVGYRVVAKSERMAAYFNGPNRVRTEFHLFLHPGRYLIFANSPGDYARGEFAELTVSA